MNYMTVIAQKVKSYAHEHRLTLSAFAKRSKISSYTLTRILNGKAQDITLTTAILLAKSLEIPLHKLFDPTSM